MTGRSHVQTGAALACALGVVLGAAPASAQSIDLTRPDPIASELTDLRLDSQSERRDAGIALLVTGLASVVAGAVSAGVGFEDPFWLAFGVGTGGWGAVNAALAIGMLDIGDGGRRRIEEDRALRHDELARAREDAIREHDGRATLFAFNLGLDVFYIATGALLFLLADQLGAPDEQEYLRGYSVAQIGQGGFLLLFDLIEWIGSKSRADRLAELPMPRW